MITISKPQSNDAEGINEVIKLSWYATYITPEIGITKEDVDLMYAQNEKRQIEVFRHRAEYPKENDISFVAKDEEKVVGFIRLKIHADDIELMSMYVHPEYTGKGVGTNLWQEVLKFLPSNKTIFTEPVQHTKSIDFYTKLGFVDTGERYQAEEKMQSSGVQLPIMKMIYTNQ